jgi:hypothetical protein
MTQIVWKKCFFSKRWQCCFVEKIARPLKTCFPPLWPKWDICLPLLTGLWWALSSCIWSFQLELIRATMQGGQPDADSCPVNASFFLPSTGRGVEQWALMMEPWKLSFRISATLTPSLCKSSQARTPLQSSRPRLTCRPSKATAHQGLGSPCGHWMLVWDNH